LGQLRAELAYASAEEIIEGGLHEFVDDLQQRLNVAGEAISEARIFNNPELSMEWEDGINKETMAKFKELGYELDRSFKDETADDRIGDVKGILIDPWNSKLYGAADSPRPGRAIGINNVPKK